MIQQQRDRLLALLSKSITGLVSAEAEELLILAIGLAPSDIREIACQLGEPYHVGRAAAIVLVDFGWARLGKCLLTKFEE